MSRRRKKVKAPVLAWRSERPTVVLIWIAPTGEVRRVTREWRRPCTDAAAREWIEDYFERIEAGYRPEGFHEPPMPHCVRVSILHRVVAEWNRPLTMNEMERLDRARAS